MTNGRSGMSLQLQCKGDLHIDDHHTCVGTHSSPADISQRRGLCSGAGRGVARGAGAGQGHQALRLGVRAARRGARHSASRPLNVQALSRAVVDISSRPYCVAELDLVRLTP